MTKLEIISQLADLKETDYKTNLLLASLIELLIEKNLVTKVELANKAQIIDFISELEIDHDQKQRAIIG